MIHKKTMTSF